MRRHRAQEWHTPYIYKTYIPGSNWGWAWICRVCGHASTSTHLTRKWARASWDNHMRNHCGEQR